MTNDALFLELLDRFVREQVTYLRAMAYKLGPDPARADDIVQETLLVAVKKADCFDSGRDVRPWLGGILRNLCRRAWEDKIRDDKVQKDALASYMEALSEDASPLCEQEALNALEKCLARVSEHSRLLINLRYNVGRTSESIAREIGTTASNVRVSLVRVKEQLKRCVKNAMAMQGGDA